jgi:environmental stress-induced protein Ves
VPYDALPATAWRNGGGVTRVVDSAPSEAAPGFRWRISIARVDAPGPFSAFPGVERTLVVAGRTPLALVVDGVRTDRGPGEVLTFGGESTVRADVGEAGATVLNVMTCRGTPAARVETLQLGSSGLGIPGPGARRSGTLVQVADATAVVVLAGAVTVQGRWLGALDTVLPGGGPVLLRSAAALVAVVRID